MASLGATNSNPLLYGIRRTSTFTEFYQLNNSIASLLVNLGLLQWAYSTALEFDNDPTIPPAFKLLPGNAFDDLERPEVPRQEVPAGATGAQQAAIKTANEQWDERRRNLRTFLLHFDAAIGIASMQSIFGSNHAFLPLCEKLAILRQRTIATPQDIAFLTENTTPARLMTNGQSFDEAIEQLVCSFEILQSCNQPFTPTQKLQRIRALLLEHPQLIPILTQYDLANPAPADHTFESLVKFTDTYFAQYGRPVITSTSLRATVSSTHAHEPDLTMSANHTSATDLQTRITSLQRELAAKQRAERNPNSDRGRNAAHQGAHQRSSSRQGRSPAGGSRSKYRTQSPSPSLEDSSSDEPFFCSTHGFKGHWSCDCNDPGKYHDKNARAPPPRRREHRRRN